MHGQGVRMRSLESPSRTGRGAEPRTVSAPRSAVGAARRFRRAGTQPGCLLPAAAGHRRRARGRHRADRRHELRRRRRPARAGSRAGAAGVRHPGQAARPLRAGRARDQQVDPRRGAGGLPARHAVRAAGLAGRGVPDQRVVRQAAVRGARFDHLRRRARRARLHALARHPHRSHGALPPARARLRGRSHRGQARARPPRRGGDRGAPGPRGRARQRARVRAARRARGPHRRRAADPGTHRHRVRRRARPHPRGKVAEREDHPLAALHRGARLLGRDRRAARHLAARNAAAQDVAVL